MLQLKERTCMRRGTRVTTCPSKYSGETYREAALVLFEESAAKQTEATELGDYKAGNKYYDKLVEAVNFLKATNSIDKIRGFLSYSSVGVRMWAAAYSLPFDEKEATKVLREIINGSGIHALTAETTLIEWQKGNLKF